MGMNEGAWSGGFRKAVGDASLGTTLALVLDSATKQLHICDAGDSRTDWALTADSYPSVYIHDIAAPSTDYLKMFHDGTNANIDGVGATTINLAIDGTTTVSIAASGVIDLVTQSLTSVNASGSTDMTTWLAAMIGADGGDDEDPKYAIAFKVGGTTAYVPCFATI